MFGKFVGRDRLVMAGLIVLGILTVVAGFVSGRSTFQYALSTDARHASTQWVRAIEGQLLDPALESASTVAKMKVIIAEPEQLSVFRQEAARSSDDLEIAPSVNGKLGLLAGIDKLFSGWITQLTRFLDDESYVSQVRNFAVLDSSGDVVVRTAGLEPGSMHALLTDGVFQSEFHKAIGLQSTRIIERMSALDLQTGEFRKLLIMPLIHDRSVRRVYVFDVDQSSAATMSKVALVAASMMTSLLIVLGYSVPAAVAFRRIRERWKAEDQIRFLAMHDPLTGLSNRVQLQMRLEQAITRAKRHKQSVAVMCIDLDRFKEVNDSLGHKAGDALLIEVASRLRQCVRETDVVARLGGDEFVVVAEELEQPSDAIPVARRICQKLSEPADIESHEISISGSVGITFAPGEGTEIEALLSNADLALYRAKNDGRNTFRFFEPEMDEAIQNRRVLATELRQAVRNGGLHLNYQPHFDLKTGLLTGYEALARWTHPEQGDVPPSVFIPIAEESGLIGMLGEWVLETACEYARHWPAGTTLSVNISPAQFAAQNLAATVRAVTARTGLPPERLLLEFTEDLLLRKAQDTIDTLQKLTAMGVRLSIDNFGSGYSSLSYLTRLPVSKIKIDQSFIRKMASDKDASAIVRTIIGIGKSLDMTIVAEGVETEDEAFELRQAGCGEVQGYFFGRPSDEIQVSKDGSPLYSHDTEIPGKILDPVQIETDYPELPQIAGGEQSPTLSNILQGESERDEDQEIARYLGDEDADQSDWSENEEQDEGSQTAQIMRLHPERTRRAG